MEIDPLNPEQLVELTNTYSSITMAHATIAEKVEGLAQRVTQVEHHQALMARAQSNFLTIFEKVEEQQERLIEAQEILTNNQASLANAVKQLADSQLQLTRFVERLDDKLASTNAAMERLDRIIDYLMREKKKTSDD